MKILVVSDTHGHDENLMRVLQREWPIDALIHCGDLEKSLFPLTKDQRIISRRL